MKVNRPELDAALLAFVRERSGVVLGAPGVGKTHSLGTLAATLSAQEVPFLFISVEELGDATEEDVRRALGYRDATFTEQLQSLYGLPAGVVVFDGFDAARNAEVRTRVLQLVRSAVKSAPGRWSVIVSVRNFDAAKSPLLLELFPGRTGKAPVRYRDQSVRARHFVIPELTDSEVAEAVAQIPGFGRVYSAAGEGLRRLARTPFNLWLIERVMVSRSNPDELTMLESETQLLALYWNAHVSVAQDAEQRLRVLERATMSMVAQHRISCPASDVYEPEFRAAWNALLSEEVLSELGAAKNRTAFTHNILFDYAVSVLAIDEGQGALSAFLTADPSRPLFLRPSLVYYLTRLWHQQRGRFWAAYWEVVGATAVPVRLVGRLIPPYVITSECREFSDLAPLLQRRTQQPDEGVPAVLRVLQALRFAAPRTTEAWLPFGAEAAKVPDVAFAWELASFLTGVAEQPQEARSRETLGRAARDLFNWAWGRRRGDRGTWFDGFASLRALPLVVATFDTDVNRSSEIVRGVFELLAEPNFPIRYFNAIADGIEHVIACAPELAAAVYEAAFSHEEQSEDKTHMGGIVLPLLSNRRQDFSMVQYILAKAYPEFVRAAPSHAVPAAFKILNRFAVVHVSGYLREGKTVEDVTQDFSFRGQPRRYIRDLSASWRQVLRGEEKDIGEDVLRFLVDPENEMDSGAVVDIAAAQAAAASTWSILLEAGAERPEKYAQPLFELAVARPVQLGPDTLQTLGSFVEAAAPHWSVEQRLKFEESVLALPSGESAPGEARGDESYEQRVRDRLLARIPRALVVSAPARTRVERLAAEDALPSNDPLVKYTVSSRAYGVTEWLMEQGVDPRAPQNAPLLALSDELRQFAERWTNKKPDPDAVSPFVPLLARALAALDQASATEMPAAVSASAESAADSADETPGADPKVVEQVWTQIAAAAGAVARSRPDPSTELYTVARDLLLRASASRPPDVAADANETFTSPGWSPTPRTEAIQGLGYLAEVSDDGRIVDALASLAQSADPAERYLAMRHAVSLRVRWRDRLWNLLEQRWASEANAVVLTTILDTIAHAGGGQDERGLKLIKDIVSHWVSGVPMRCEAASHLTNAIAGWVLYLACHRQEAWAVELSRAAVSGLPDSLKLLDALVHEAVQQVTPAALARPTSEAPTRRVVAWLARAIDGLRQRVVAVQPDIGGQASAESERELSEVHRLVHAVVVGLLRNRDSTVERDDEDAEPAEEPSREAKRAAFRVYYDTVLPLLRAVLRFSDTADGAGGMVAGTAHSFMELLNEFLAFDPAAVVAMAADVATAGGAGNYQLDPVAVREVVKLVEVILVDHRDQVSAGKPLEDMLRLLDVFADAGWPEAMRLVWRLDEVFR